MKKTVLLTLLATIFLFLSCDKKQSPTITSPQKEYYRIKLNKYQMQEVGRKRFLTLNKNQSKYLKNKVREFHVGGPNYYTPEGWFCANWVKPDEVIIEKYLIDNYEKSVSNLYDVSTSENSNSEPKQIAVNIDINGNYYYNNKNISIESILKKISKLADKFKQPHFSVYISYAPIENNTLLKKKVLLNVDRVKKICEQKGIHFQDDW